VFGESRVNVHALFEQLRKEGDLTLVGAEAAISENKWKRHVLQAPFHHASSVGMPSPDVQAAMDRQKLSAIMQDDIWQWHGKSCCIHERRSAAGRDPSAGQEPLYLCIVNILVVSFPCLAEC